MKLSAHDQNWIVERMKIYDIKYQEIYNEILDHIITAVEQKRGEGDTHDILVLFQQVVDEHFNGYLGMENLAVEQEKIFLQSIRHLKRQSFKHYFNWPILFFAVFALVMSFKLPDVKLVRVSFLVGCILLAMSPVIYTIIVLWGKVKTIKGKQSLFKGHLVTQALMPALLLNSMIYLPQVFFDTDFTESRWSSFKYISPPMFMGALVIFIFLNLVTIRFAKQLIAAKILT